MATIEDVARLTGLSRSTVSRVINHYPHVSDDKKKRVHEAMKLLNYYPNSAAQRLRSQKTNMIAVLIPVLTNPFFAHLLERIDTAATEHNMQLLVCQTRNDKKKELQFLDLLKTKQVDGVILTAIENDWEDIKAYTSFGPILLCNEYVKTASVPKVYGDQIAGSYAGTRHLIEQGYKRIAYCSGGGASELTSDREIGYRRAMKEFGLPVYEEWVFQNIFDIADGRQVVKRIVSMENRPDAVFAGSDQVGAGIILEARIQGLHIPKDLAVIGFDDQEIAEVVDLTTIRQPINEIGKYTMEEMLRCLAHKEESTPHEIQFPLELVIRKSTRLTKDLSVDS
ncbi:LacI family DNA-binding transcriptional regulator [Bacillus sp. OTU530]|uniref:LacI family DNA-binding transcriptional regulator n=1 Tax=Bacillus sp. OTU530 TaxID=3043862 RepID=UPI00313B2775